MDVPTPWTIPSSVDVPTLDNPLPLCYCAPIMSWALNKGEWNLFPGRSELTMGIQCSGPVRHRSRRNFKNCLTES